MDYGIRCRGMKLRPQAYFSVPPNHSTTLRIDKIYGRAVAKLAGVGTLFDTETTISIIVPVRHADILLLEGYPTPQGIWHFTWTLTVDDAGGKQVWEEKFLTQCFDLGISSPDKSMLQWSVGLKNKGVKVIKFVDGKPQDIRGGPI